MKSSFFHVSRALSLLAWLATGACGDDDPARSASASTAVDAAVPDAGPASSPAYVVVERVFAPDTRLYFVSVLPAMPSGVIDRAQAREFSSADIELYEGKLYLRDRDSSTVTRFGVTPERKLVEEAQLSLQALGLPTTRIHNAYLSPTSAFVLNRRDWSLIEWNPSTMSLTGREISMDFARKQGIDGFINDPVRIGDRIFAPVHWQDDQTYRVFPGTGLLVIDPAQSDRPALYEDARIASGFKLARSDDGDAYVLGSVFAEYRLFGAAVGGGAIPPSGVLRVKRGERGFDPSYFVDVDAITKSPNIWGMYRVDERYLLVQMWDPAVPVKASTQEELDNAYEYIYAMVDTQEKTWKRVEALPKGGAGNSGDHRVDGRLHIQVYVPNGQGPEGADAVVYAVTAAGVEEKFRVPSGDLWFAGRIR